MAITLEQMKAKAAEARKELEELEGAIRVMERFGDGKSGKKSDVKITSDESDAPNLGESGEIKISDLKLPKKAVRRTSTLLDDVKNVIERLGNQEFTVNHVYAALKQMGKASDAKHYKNRVSVTIRNLVAENFLTRTHKGKGNDPHRYRRAAGKVSLVTKNA